MRRWGLAVVLMALGAGPAAGQPYSTTPLDGWGVNGPVDAIERAGNRLFVGGDFTRAARVRGGAIKVSGATGDRLPQFDPRIPSGVRAIAADGEGGWYVGGEFGNNFAPAGQFIRLRSDGTRDARFRPVLQEVRSIAVFPDRVIIAGPSILVLDRTTGARLATFAVPEPEYVEALSGNRLLVTTYVSPRIRMLDAQTGATVWTPDITFPPVFTNGWLFDVAIADDQLYVCGGFTSANGQPRAGLAAYDLSTRQLTAWNPDRGASSISSACELAASPTTVYLLRSGSVNEAFAINRTTGVVNGGWLPALNFPTTGQRPWMLPRLLAAHGRVYFFSNSDQFFFVDLFLWAVDETTGALISSFAPRPDAGVWTAVADGSDLIIGGDFVGTQSVTANALLAIDLDSGNLLDWNHQLARNHNVLGLAVAGGRLFARMGPNSPPVLAFDTSTLVSLPWPTPVETVRHLLAVGDRVVIAGRNASSSNFSSEALLVLDPVTAARTTPPLMFDHSSVGSFPIDTVGRGTGRVYVAGGFTAINGVTRARLAAIDVMSGAVLPWNPAPPPFNALPERIVLGPGFVALDGYRNVIGVLDQETGALLAEVDPYPLISVLSQLQQLTSRSAVLTRQRIGPAIDGDDFVDVIDIATGRREWTVAGDFRSRRGVGPAGPVSAWPDYLVASGGTRINDTAGGRLFIFAADRLTPTLRVSLEGTRANVSWTVPPGVTATGFRADIGRTPGGAELVNDLFIGTITSGALTLAPGLYYFRIRAEYGDVRSGPSNEVVVSIDRGPLPPDRLRATVDGFRVSLTWQTPASSPPADVILIEAGTLPGASDVGVVTVPGSFTSLAGILSPGTYYVRLRSQVGGVPSSPTPEVVISIRP